MCGSLAGRRRSRRHRQSPHKPLRQRRRQGGGEQPPPPPEKGLKQPQETPAASPAGTGAPFKEGDKVLVQDKGGRHWQATIIQVDADSKQAQIQREGYHAKKWWVPFSILSSEAAAREGVQGNEAPAEQPALPAETAPVEPVGTKSDQYLNIDLRHEAQKELLLNSPYEDGAWLAFHEKYPDDIKNEETIRLMWRDLHPIRVTEAAPEDNEKRKIRYAIFPTPQKETIAMAETEDEAVTLFRKHHPRSTHTDDEIRDFWRTGCAVQREVPPKPAGEDLEVRAILDKYGPKAQPVRKAPESQAQTVKGFFTGQPVRLKDQQKRAQAGVGTVKRLDLMSAMVMVRFRNGTKWWSPDDLEPVVPVEEGIEV